MSPNPIPDLLFVTGILGFKEYTQKYLNIPYIAAHIFSFVGQRCFVQGALFQTRPELLMDSFPKVKRPVRGS